ncbi:hypothetical protein EG68_03649 [Paragonimus skrjabini miyazakii]|uniref:Tetraspanin n=1 Tax=Paragonimus skrjabini miyazakii TaxID=59628 RepID=A0A8S9Z0M6_9TREM|nr:hypothetical protein EG68_03649 [Paragonimus skrjabini miyazakii]
MEQDYYYTHAIITNQQCTLNLHHLLFSLSCVSWCSGCLSITLSLYESFYADHRVMRLHGFNKLFIEAVILGVCGILLLGINSVGCAGIVKRSKNLLNLFIVFTVLIFGVYLGCGLWTSKYYMRIEDDLDQLLTSLVTQYNESKLMVDEDTKFLNFLHFKLQCCGKNGVWDFDRRRPILSCGSNPSNRPGCLPVVRDAMQAGLFRIAALAYSEVILQASIAILTILSTYRT